jgi:hypothetical protein
MGWGDLLIRGSIRESSLASRQARKNCQAFFYRHFVKKFRENVFVCPQRLLEHCPVAGCKVDWIDDFPASAQEPPNYPPMSSNIAARGGSNLLALRLKLPSTCAIQNS